MNLREKYKLCSIGKPKPEAHRCSGIVRPYSASECGFCYGRAEEFIFAKDVIAHQCKGKIKPYPAVLCSTCRSEDEVEKHLTVKDLVAIINEVKNDDRTG